MHLFHDIVIKWNNFPRNWPFVRKIHWSTVNSPLKGQWRGVLMFSLICVWINGWVNDPEADDLRRYRVNYDVIVMLIDTQMKVQNLLKLIQYLKHGSKSPNPSHIQSKILTKWSLNARELYENSWWNYAPIPMQYDLNVFGRGHHLQ